MDLGIAAYVTLGVALVAVLVVLSVRRLAKAHSIATYVDLVSRVAARERALEQPGPPGPPGPPEDIVPAILDAFFDDALVKLRGEGATFQELQDIGANLQTIRRESMSALTPTVASRFGDVDARFLSALERRIGPAPAQDAGDQSVALVKTYLDAVHPFAGGIAYQRWSPVRWVASAEQFYWAVDLWYTAPTEAGDPREHQHLFLVQHGVIVDVLDGQSGAPSETTTLVKPAQRAEREAQAHAASLVREVAERLAPGLAGEQYRFPEPPRFLIDRIRAIDDPAEKKIALKELARFAAFLATHQGSDGAAQVLLEVLTE